jgi:hypothetical protein
VRPDGNGFIEANKRCFYDLGAIGRDCVGHSINPQQLFQGQLRVELRNGVGDTYLTTGTDEITNVLSGVTIGVDYHATLLFVHRY